MIDVSFIPTLFLQTFSLQELFGQWQSVGIFDFLLPTLLIFAVIFGILTTTNILGSQKGISFLIAASIALLAMQYPMVSNFFSVIFPNIGIALAIILGVIILVGIFIADETRRRWFNQLGYGALGIGIIVVIVTLNQYDWFGSIWWQENWVSILWIVILVILVSSILSGPTEKKEGKINFHPLRGASNGH